LGGLQFENNLKGEQLNSTTNRNILKEVQLKKLKEKLHVAGHDRSHKKINMVKALKNLKKREQRK